MTKQLEFTTSKGKFLIIDNHYETEESFSLALLEIKDFDNVVEITELGKVKELTEEQWKAIVDNHIIPFDESVTCYPDYTVDGFKGLDTATESGMSLLHSLNVYLNNPYGEDKPVKLLHSNGSLDISEKLMKSYQDKWQEAQEKVWLNPVIFRVV